MGIVSSVRALTRSRIRRVAPVILPLAAEVTTGKGTGSGGTEDGNPRRVAGRPRGAAAAREGALAAGGRARTSAPRAALGPLGQGVPLRHRRRPAHAGGAVR